MSHTPYTRHNMLQDFEPDRLKNMFSLSTFFVNNGEYINETLGSADIVGIVYATKKFLTKTSVRVIDNVHCERWAVGRYGESVVGGLVDGFDGKTVDQCNNICTQYDDPTLYRMAFERGSRLCRFFGLSHAANAQMVKKRERCFVDGMIMFYRGQKRPNRLEDYEVGVSHERGYELASTLSRVGYEIT